MTAPRTGPGSSPGFLLWHVTLRWQRDVSAALHPLDLTHVQFVLLATLWWLAHGDRSAAGPVRPAPSQRELADLAGTDPMMTSQVLRTLESRLLLERRADPDDGRIRRVHPTPAGAALARRAIEVVEAVDAQFFAPVDDPEVLLRVLSMLGRGEGKAGRVP